MSKSHRPQKSGPSESTQGPEAPTGAWAYDDKDSNESIQGAFAYDEAAHGNPMLQAAEEALSPQGTPAGYEGPPQQGTPAGYAGPPNAGLEAYAGPPQTGMMGKDNTPAMDYSAGMMTGPGMSVEDPGKHKYDKLSSLGAKYQGEHHEAKFRGGHKRDQAGDIKRKVTTLAMNEVGLNNTAVDGKDGLLVDSKGQPVDTKGAKPGLKDSEMDRMIYAMGPDGDMHMKDASAETAKHSSSKHHQYFHHSSFYQGDDVAGAGDMEVKDGWVKSVSNSSGHYTPGKDQLLNTLTELDERGVNTDVSKAELHDHKGQASYPAGPFLKSEGDTELLDKRSRMLDDIGTFDRSSLKSGDE